MADISPPPPVSDVPLHEPGEAVQVPVGVPTDGDGGGDGHPHKEYDLPVDEQNRAKRIKLWSIKRPHMRAFHFAWSSFFLAFFGWFALAPLQNNIRRNNAWLAEGNNFKHQNIISVAGTIIMRVVIGPFCDRFGPRLAQSLLLGVFSIPLFLVGTARNFVAWTTARFFIGFMGATFVVTQFWTSIMFSGSIVGTANATTAGWGNLGGGVTQAIMPLIRAGVAKAQGINPNDINDDKAWRLAVLVPASALVVTSIGLYLLSDDLPEGNYRDLHRTGQKEVTNPFKAMGRAAGNWRVWVLFILYAGCFGIELIMNTNLATYFAGNQGKEAFTLDERLAGTVAALFGLMNIFARSLGGIGSDLLARKLGLRGRLWWFFFTQLMEGVFFVVFSQIKVLGGAIPTLIVFSLFVQMSEGATFGIVPFVDPSSTGAVSGIVGAGGNFGAVAGGFLVNSQSVGGISTGFRNLGFIVIGSAFLIPLLHFPEYGSMFVPPKKTTQVEEVIEEEGA